VACDTLRLGVGGFHVTCHHGDAAGGILYCYVTLVSGVRYSLTRCWWVSCDLSPW
jgi:hypothetical protein